ncbi:MAG: hypothetical protein FWD15_00505 [Alphaproteobacteria bacterium]|nr:hypothetical protein [Alphaproteobacteria bacterium]
MVKQSKLTKIDFIRIKACFFGACAFVAAIIVGALISGGSVVEAFGASAGLNSLIVGLFVAGVVANFVNQFKVIRGAFAMNAYMSGERNIHVPSEMRFAFHQLASGGKAGHGYMDMGAAEKVAAALRARVSGFGYTSKYIAGILVFIGLLGTFWGLLVSVGAAGTAVSGGADLEAVRRGILAPIGGMRVAFSTSLFGLGLSLAVGFLQFLLDVMKRDFCNQAEDSIMSLARASVPQQDGVNAGTLTYLKAMIEQTADAVGALQRVIAKANETSAETAAKMGAMGSAVVELAGQMQTRLKQMDKMSMVPEKMIKAMDEMLKMTKSGFGMDSATKEHIRLIDFKLSEMTETLSADIRLLAKSKL